MTAPAAAATPYDAVAYLGHPFAQTHPSRLAAIAFLHGIAPPDIANARALELACGDGGNLIPMALTLPEARFTGIDLSGTAIDRGRQTIAELGLTNITLIAGDILDPVHKFAQSDYIIAHGLYSWCPPAVRDRAMQIIGDSLAPNGIAYVSYNALPGGRIRQMLREMMLFHVHDIADPDDRAEQSQALLSLAAEGRVHSDPYRELLRKEVERMDERDRWALFHDELGEYYEPFYLHQFVEHAERHGLQYLSDANFPNLRDASITEDAHAILDEIGDGDRVLREQYADFIRCRRFHHTLLCRKEADVLPLDPARFAGLCFSTSAVAISPTEFRAPGNAGINTENPLAQAALNALIASAPQALSFDTLASHVDYSSEQLATFLLTATIAGLVEPNTAQFALATSPGPHPTASPLARLQASRGSNLTTLTHGTLRVEDPRTLDLLHQLDGTRDCQALMAATGLPADQIEAALQLLAKAGVLVG